MKYFCALSSWLSPYMSWVWAAFPTGVSASTKVNSFWHFPWWKAAVSARFVKRKCNSAKKKLGWWLTRVTLPFCEFFVVWSLQAPSTWVYPKPPLLLLGHGSAERPGVPAGPSPLWDKWGLWLVQASQKVLWGGWSLAVRDRTSSLDFRIKSHFLE